MATAALQNWVRKKDSIVASATKVVDTIPVSKFIAAHYIIAFENVAGTVVKTLKLSVRKDSSSVTDTVYAKVGIMDIAINTQINGSDFELEMINSEAFNVNLKLIRTLI